jgi:hypothetical protein
MNKKILFVTGIVFVFVIVALVWYFFFATPKDGSLLVEKQDPVSSTSLPPRFLFIGDEPNTKDSNASSFTSVTQKKEDPLLRIWDKPTTGNTFIENTTLKEVTATTTVGTGTVLTRSQIRATTTILLFVDRETGFVYGYDTQNISLFQITNTSVPGVYDAYIYNNGKSILFRYADRENESIVSLIATLPNISPNMSPTSLINEEYLNLNVSSVTISDDGVALFYTVTTEDSSNIYELRGGKSTFITSSPFREWILSANAGRLYATPKASSYAFGIVTTVPGFIPISKGLAGLQITPGAGGYITSFWDKGEIGTRFERAGDSFTFPFRVIATKCSFLDRTVGVCGVPTNFSYDMNLPDDWLKGLTSFKDELWIFDVTKKEASLYYSFDESLGEFDIVNIKGNTLFISFINKKSGNLWLIQRAVVENRTI